MRKHFKNCVENCKCNIIDDINCKCVNECMDENPYAYGRRSIFYK